MQSCGRDQGGVSGRVIVASGLGRPLGWEASVPAPCPWDPALPNDLGTASPFSGDKGMVLAASSPLFTPLVGRNGEWVVAGQTRDLLPVPFLAGG